MAFRMQSSVPETMNVAEEPDYIYELYGEDARTLGTYAANCLLARRLAECDVRFIQVYHQGWDQHNNLLGMDYERLTFKHQGRRYRLTDVHGEVVQDLLI